MREHIRAYFSFSRKERTGIAILLVIILTVAIAPAFIGGELIISDSATVMKYQAYFVALETRQKDSAFRPQRQQSVSGVAYERAASVLTPFAFDPNTIGTEGWKRLGIRERTALSIAKYLAKGGRFRRSEDINKIYGLSEEEKQVLLPYVHIAGESQIKPTVESTGHNGTRSQSFTHSTGVDSSSYPRRQYAQTGIKAGSNFENIDINEADTISWRSLPGIGPVLSKRIYTFREKLGGFFSVDQVAEVYGLPDSTFQRIKPYLRCDAKVTRLNLNQATQAALEQHPYFRRNVARAIIDYRNQHGAFKDVNELRQLVVVTQEIFDRLLPYVSL